jgi:hypothetical protein
MRTENMFARASRPSFGTLPMLAHASVRGSRMTLVDAYIIEGLRLPIAWSMMKTDPYP